MRHRHITAVIDINSHQAGFISKISGNILYPKFWEKRGYVKTNIKTRYPANSASPGDRCWFAMMLYCFLILCVNCNTSLFFSLGSKAKRILLAKNFACDFVNNHRS